MSLNKLTLSGRLGDDSELRYAVNGKGAVLTFSLAVSEWVPGRNGDKGHEYTSWVNCALFGKRAEALQVHLTKGVKVAIIGHLHQNRWEQDGERRSSLEVRVDDLELMTYQKQQRDTHAKASDAAASDVYESDIPF